MSQNNNIAFTMIDYVIIGSSMVFILCSLIYISVEYAHLPDQIPSHFNHKGEADAFGAKSTLWLVSGLFAALTLGIFFLAKTVSVHNIQLKSKEANFRAIAIFMPFISIIQATIVYSMIQSAKGIFKYSSWILPFILTITVITIISMFVIISKNKKS